MVDQDAAHPIPPERPKEGSCLGAGRAHDDVRQPVAQSRVAGNALQVDRCNRRWRHCRAG